MEFNRAFAAHLSPDGLISVRADLVREEAAEVIEALATGDRGEVAHELADLVYVTIGLEAAARELAGDLGIDLNAAITAVHEANMSKRYPDGTVLYRQDGKVLKGPNYRPPDMSAALAGAR